MRTTGTIQPFDYESRPVRVIFGPGRIREVGPELDRLGIERVMLISDGHAPGGRELATTLGPRLALHWQEVIQHVPVELAERASNAARDRAVDAVVTVGGGSATGLAKAIALDSGLPILAIPTTYAGSELTPVYGMTGQQRKRTGTDERVRPRVVIYDPRLTLGLPASVTGPSAFNALAHCFAALWSPRGDPLTSALAADAIRTVTLSLPVLRDTPDDLAARSGLQYAAFLAGTALAKTGTGLQHKICHALGGRLNLAHADTHSVILPHVVALNAGCGHDWVDRVRPMLGQDPAERLLELAGASGLPTNLAGLGARREYLRAVAEDVAGTPNPVPVDAERIEKLLEQALGTPPEGVA